MSTLAVNTITNATGGNTATINGMTPTAQSLQGFRNRIINGGMVIDQRNNGASVTPDNSGVLSVDRWKVWEDTDGSATVQQSTTAPAGFSNSLVWTTTSADTSLGAAQYACVGQLIEGFNVSDFGWGTASAQSVTLSFWVRSSLIGTFGGSLVNGAPTFVAYPFTYTISAANTWEQKTITIAGPTSGTWATNNSAGIRLYFGLGVGSTYSGTAGSWASGALLLSATGATSVVGTSGATFYITGVQLEAGSVATPFERRPYGTELMLCQRYFELFGQQGSGMATSATNADLSFSYSVPKRATPTIALVTSASAQLTEPLINVRTATAISAVYAGVSNGCLLSLAVAGGGMTTRNLVVAYPEPVPNGFLSASAEL